MLNSYSFMPKEVDIAFYYEVWEEITALKWYFYKFAGIHGDEAMQRTLIHTLTHFNPNRGNLSAYIKKLAREITKGNTRMIPVDFLEQTLSADADEEAGATTSTVAAACKVVDFSEDIIENMDRLTDKRDDIVKLALEFMDKFVTLCEALIRHDTSTKYYPNVFIKQCLRLSGKCENFNQLCLDVFLDYKDDFKWFLDSAVSEDEVWRESDYSIVNGGLSKRVRLVSPETGEDVENPDIEPWVVVGKLASGINQKRLLRVSYIDLWEYMCDLIDSDETNEMKFIIDNNYIIRTPGGSISVLNPDLYSEYDLIRAEIISNLVSDTRGKLISVGSENIYILVNSDCDLTPRKRNLYGYSIEFDYEDITDTIL